tara:strand:- start:367 stop:1344 length:978 start_codon:yes stop_codon:yes gene_type:complete
MSTIGKTKFVFPDEDEGALEIESSSATEMGKEIEVEIEDVEVEVIDDTPEEDRGRKESEPPEDITDEELANYGESVQKRIKKFSKGYHDERRAKEKSLREQQELQRYAAQLLASNKELKGSVNKTQTALLEQAKVTAESEVAKAKRAYKEAHESGDSDALVEAQESLTSAKIKHDRVNNFTLDPLQEDEEGVKTEGATQESSPQPVADEKSQDWFSKNKWFGDDGPMTGYALGLHEQLVKNQGYDPKSDEYYDAINSRMRSVFPDKFSGDEGSRTQKRSTNVVASGKRGSKPRKVTLNASQVAIANKLGVPLALYAKELEAQGDV